MLGLARETQQRGTQRFLDDARCHRVHAHHDRLGRRQLIEHLHMLEAAVRGAESVATKACEAAVEPGLIDRQVIGQPEPVRDFRADDSQVSHGLVQPSKRAPQCAVDCPPGFGLRQKCSFLLLAHGFGSLPQLVEERRVRSVVHAPNIPWRSRQRVDVAARRRCYTIRGLSHPPKP